MTSLPPAILRSGDAMPMIGMGLWKVSQDVCADTVYEAIKAGVRMFDSSSDYGNEKQSGEGMQRAIKAGLVERKDLFIVTKLWNTFKQADKVEPEIKRQLANWQTDYFDLYLIHFPIALKYVDPSTRYPPEWSFDGSGTIEIERSPLHLTWAAMESLVHNGLTKNIGVCSFPGALLMDLMTYAKVLPAVLQVECHPYNAQQDLLDMCNAFGIKMMAFSSLGPASWVELGIPSVSQVDSLLTLPVVSKIAEAHSQSTGQVLLRWATQRGIIIIPKSIKPERMAENLTSGDFDLTEEELNKISSLDRKFRMGDPKAFDPRIAIFA